MRTASCAQYGTCVLDGDCALFINCYLIGETVRTKVTYHGITHECDDPHCHVTGYVATLLEAEAINELVNRRVEEEGQ